MSTEAWVESEIIVDAVWFVVPDWRPEFKRDEDADEFESL